MFFLKNYYRFASVLLKFALSFLERRRRCKLVFIARGREGRKEKNQSCSIDFWGGNLCLEA